jgi:uncharacterized protein (DUF1810 family)
MSDSHNLMRFVSAQDFVYPQVGKELAAGRKTTHWMWFVFPQLKGLGFSAMAQTYGITSLAEAEAYLQHPILGTRLRECVAAVNRIEGSSAHQIFGSPDDVKFRSCLTLFHLAAPDEPLFRQVLEKYFEGDGDPRTVERLPNRRAES